MQFKLVCRGKNAPWWIDCFAEWTASVSTERRCGAQSSGIISALCGSSKRLPPPERKIPVQLRGRICFSRSFCCRWGFWERKNRILDANYAVSMLAGKCYPGPSVEVARPERLFSILTLVSWEDLCAVQAQMLFQYHHIWTETLIDE